MIEFTKILFCLSHVDRVADVCLLIQTINTNASRWTVAFVSTRQSRFCSLLWRFLSRSSRSWWKRWFINTSAYRGLINACSEKPDTSLKDHFISTAVSKRTSKEIQNDLLDCILTVYQNYINNKKCKAKTNIFFNQFRQKILCFTRFVIGSCLSIRFK